MNRYVASRLAGERDRIKRERETDQRYREAYDSGLEFMTTPQVDLARERARDRITPSQPSQEVPHMDRHFIELNKTTVRKDALADSGWLIWVGLVIAMAAFLWGLMA